MPGQQFRTIDRVDCGGLAVPLTLLVDQLIQRIQLPLHSVNVAAHVAAAALPTHAWMLAKVRKELSTPAPSSLAVGDDVLQLLNCTLVPQHGLNVFLHRLA